MKRAALCILLTIFCFVLPDCTDLPQPAVPDAPGTGVIAIAGTDFTTGFLSTFEIQSGNVVRDIAPLYNDTLLYFDSGLFAVQRLGSDSLRRLDNLAAYATLYETSAGSRSNPQGLAVLPGSRVALSFYNKNSIEIRHAGTGSLLQEIDLSAWADTDGFAEIGQLYYRAGYLYAAVQRLNRQATDGVWPPSGTSYLLRIDTSTWVITPFALSHSNPASRLHFNAGRNSLVFAAPGRFAANYALDGACLEFDLGLQAFKTPPITEVQAGYDIADCDIKADGTGVFMGYDAALGSVMAAFDVSGNTITRVAAQLPASTGGYFASFLAHSNGKVYLADRNIYRPGLRVFSGATLLEDTSSAIYTGLPPLSLAEIP